MVDLQELSQEELEAMRTLLDQMIAARKESSRFRPEPAKDHQPEWDPEKSKLGRWLQERKLDSRSGYVMGHSPPKGEATKRFLARLPAEIDNVRGRR